MSVATTQGQFFVRRRSGSIFQKKAKINVEAKPAEKYLVHFSVKGNLVKIIKTDDHPGIKSRFNIPAFKSKKDYNIHCQEQENSTCSSINNDNKELLEVKSKTTVDRGKSNKVKKPSQVDKYGEKCKKRSLFSTIPEHDEQNESSVHASENLKNIKTIKIGNKFSEYNFKIQDCWNDDISVTGNLGRLQEDEEEIKTVNGLFVSGIQQYADSVNNFPKASLATKNHFYPLNAFVVKRRNSKAEIPQTIFTSPKQLKYNLLRVKIGNKKIAITSYEQLLKTMYEAVIEGEIDLLDDLLDIPGADINMEWFNENLLMAAIRAKQIEMAEFLLDNGINPRYFTNQFDVRDEESKEVDCYETTCRQMAYDSELWDLVDLIDYYNGEDWKYGKKKDRQPRLKKPLEQKLKEKAEQEEIRERKYSRNSIRSNSTVDNPERKISTTESQLTTDSRGTTTLTSKSQTEEDRTGGIANEELNKDRKSDGGTDHTDNEIDDTSLHTSIRSSTISLPESFRDVVFLEDPRPLDFFIKKNPHKYKNTKSFFSRLSASSLSAKPYKFTSSKQKSTLAGKNCITPKIKLGEHIPREISGTQNKVVRNTDVNGSINSNRRIIYPRRTQDNFPISYQISKRAKSAPQVQNRAVFQQRSRSYVSSNRIDLLLDEFDLERPTSDKQLVQKPMVDRYIKAYNYYQNNAANFNDMKLKVETGEQMGSYDHKNSLTMNDQMTYRPSSRSGSPISRLSQDQNSERRVKSSAGPYKKSYGNTSLDGVMSSVALNELAGEKYTGPKYRSPAGFLKSNMPKEREESKLPTLIKGSV